MTDSLQRLTRELDPQQVASMATPIPNFTALRDIPAYLGHAAHIRLEELLGVPVASDDARPMQSNPDTMQRSGAQLGEIVGREREFLQNLPKIEANFQKVADERGVPLSQVLDES
jgi:hypothetical protein